MDPFRILGQSNSIIAHSTEPSRYARHSRATDSSRARFYQINIIQYGRSTRRMRNGGRSEGGRRAKTLANNRAKFNTVTAGFTGEDSLSTLFKTNRMSNREICRPDCQVEVVCARVALCFGGDERDTPVVISLLKGYRFNISSCVLPREPPTSLSLPPSPIGGMSTRRIFLGIPRT